MSPRLINNTPSETFREWQRANSAAIAVLTQLKRCLVFNTLLHLPSPNSE